MRIGGFDQIASNIRSAGTCSGDAAWMCSQPLDLALARVRSSARSFTSTAQTSALGEANASASDTGPHPQPRSSSVPISGGSGTSRSSTDVPRSRREPENTPFDTSTTASCPRSVTFMRRRTSSEDGSAAKYCSVAFPSRFEASEACCVFIRSPAYR